MASITKHVDGKRWRAFVHRRNIKKSKVFISKKAAERWAKQREQEIEIGDFVDRSEAERMTLSDALDRYKSIAAGKRGARQELSRIKHLQQRKIAKLPLTKVKTVDVISLRNELLSEGLSPNTVRLYLSVISHMFNTAIAEWGFDYLVNPVKRGVMPSCAGTARDRRLEAGEEEILLNACEEYGGFIRDAVIIAIETAMRRGEIANLKWKHVDLRRRVAHLPETKNGESRDVPLSPRALEILTRRSKVRSMTDSRVFGVEPNGISQAFSRVCKAAGIYDLRFHDLRHEATTRLAERFQPLELARITGHKDMKMLLRYYNPRAEDLAKKMI